MASISTVLFLLTVPVLKTVIFATVDCVINSFCLLFCFHHWDKYYICICKGFIYLVEALCFKKSKMEEITVNLGVTSSQAKLDTLDTSSPRSMDTTMEFDASRAQSITPQNSII